MQNTTTNQQLVEKIKAIRNLYFHIRQRCENKNLISYPNYGGKGITMCELWKKDINRFVNWALLNGYEQQLEIDRIDGNKGYRPSNCRFVDHYTQTANRKPQIKNEHGQYAFSKKSNLPYNIINERRSYVRKNGTITDGTYYKVEFSRNGRKYVIGCYSSIGKAVIARDQALADFASGNLKIKGKLKKNLKTKPVKQSTSK